MDEDGGSRSRGSVESSSLGSSDGPDSFLLEVARAPALSLDEVPTAIAFPGPDESPAAGAIEPSPGDRLNDRFEILRLVGRGGFGSVYLARDLELGRQVAVKIVGAGRPRRLGQKELQAFTREATATARLRHPNIVTVYDWGTRGHHAFLVLEWLKGEPLAQRLVRGRLPADEAVAFAGQIGRALRHAHGAGVLHLDLKPQNLFLAEGEELKVLDFGLARLDLEDPSLVSGFQRSPEELREMMGTSSPQGGTPGYMAPEQWRGAALDARTDIFAVGVILYQMVTGELPFHVDRSGGGTVDASRAPAVRDRVPDVLPELDRLIAKALSKDPAERHASAEDLLTDLARVERKLADATPVQGEPYRYLESFSEEDAPWFFGRSAEASRLQAMLKAHAFVALVGSSGAGKSSLVLAGLLPRLRRDPVPWTVLSLRPGASPLARLAKRLADVCPEEEIQLATGDSLRTRPGLAGRLLRAHADRERRRVLLVVDQLEELYAQVPDASVRRAFAAALLSAGDDPDSPVRVVVTLRDDFLSRLAEHAGLREAVAANVLLLGSPDSASLTEALCGPAGRLGFELEEGLAAEVVEALGEEAAPLPILQLAASRLWDRRDPEARVLRRAVLAELGGVGGVLAAHADEVLGLLGDPAEQALARELILRLATVEGTRRQLARDELDALWSERERTARVLEHLIHGRLLTSSRHPDGIRVELAHDSLVERWDRLRTWLHEDQEQRRFQERVSQAAALWAEQGHPRSLLWTGDTLRAARRWRREYRGLSGVLEGAFLDASEAQYRRGRRLRRVLWVSALALACSATVGALLGMRAYEAQAHQARLQALLRDAVASPDPLQGALLLSELPPGKPPPGAVAAAHAILARRIPVAVLRGSREILAATLSRDGSFVLMASADGSVRRQRRDGTGRPEVLVGPSTRRIYDAKFDRAGRRVALFFPDFAVEIRRLDRPGPGIVLRGHTRLVGGAFGPDGTRFLTSSRDRTARVWWSDVTRPPVILRGHQGAVGPVGVFSPDGSRVATISRDGTARVWRADGSGEPLVLRHRFWALAPAFSPDGTRLLTGSGEGVARIWRLDAPERPVILRGHREMILHAAFHPDGSRVATASLDGTARVWRADGQGRPLVFRHGGEIRSLRFSADGTRLATGGYDGAVKVWRTDGKGEAMELRGPPAQVSGIQFSRDGASLLSVSGGIARTWSLGDPAEPRILRGHTGAVDRAMFTPDGKYVVTASLDDTVRLWPLGEAAPPQVLRVPHYRWARVSLSRDGQRLLAVSAKGTVLVWRRVAPGRFGAPATLRLPDVHLANAAFSPRGDRVVTGSAKGMVHLWHLDGREPPRLLGRHRFQVTSWADALGFSPDGARVISGSYDQTARIWRTDGRGPPVVLTGERSLVSCAMFSPDGRWVLVSFPAGVRVWPARGVGSPVVLEHGALWANFSPEGARIVTGGAGSAKVWRPDGTLVATLRGHRGQIRSVSFSPDGTRVLTSAADATARVWPADGRGDAIVLRGHGAYIESAAFSPDGTRVVTASNDRTARLWSLAWAHLRGALRGATTACLRPRARTRYLHESPAEARERYSACERRFGRGAGER